MTTKVIVFERNGAISLMWPSSEYPIEEVAKKDVPVGKPYLIVESSAIPQDPAFRAAWVVDFSSPDGYGQGYSEVIDRMAAEKHGIMTPPPNAEGVQWPPKA